MTVGEWIADRTTGAPPHLVSELQRALGRSAEADADEVPERCVEAAERIVAELVGQNRTGRDAALPLLTADALVTYAFEAAAADPDRLPARAAAAMHTLATLR